MGNWNNEHKAAVQTNLGNTRAIFIGYNIYSKRTTDKFSPKELPNHDLVLGYHTEHKLYIAWTSCAHQIFANNFVSHTFSLHKHPTEILNNREPISSFYQRLDGTKKAEFCEKYYYEKIVVIHESAIEEFCKFPMLYMMPNSEDEGYKENTIYCDPIVRSLQISNAENDGRWMSKDERIRYSNTSMSRDPSFRTRILSAYGYKCAICGETITAVLQAAHIVAVADGGGDDTSNGICLCANHHLMYDSKMFRIDATTKKIYGVDARIRKQIVEENITII